MDHLIVEKVTNFFSQYKKRKIKKGEILIEPSRDIEGAFLLTDGIVRMMTISQDGIEVTINTFRPLAFFPMGYVLNNSRDHYFYEAIENSEVWIAPVDDFKQFLEQNADVSLDLTRRIYRGLDGYMQRIETLLIGDAKLRTLGVLIIAIKRFARVGKGGQQYVPLTQKQLAEEAGLSRETITRQLKTLQKKGLVKYTAKQLYIIDLKKIEQELTQAL